jgi:hypothetical protein
MIDFGITRASGDDVGALIAQVFNSDPAIARKWAGKSVDALRRVVRRSLGRTGSDIFRGLKMAMTTNSLGLDEKAQYTPTAVFISRVMQRVRPQEIGRMGRPPKLRTPGKLGGKLSALMQYRLTPDVKRGQAVPAGDDSFEVGLIPERRGGKKWADRFRSWQQGGNIDLSQYNNGSIQSMRGYYAALGMPLRSGTMPRSPRRDLIGKYKSRIEPVEMFKKALTERLLR